MYLTTPVHATSPVLNFKSPETFFNLNSDLINLILSFLKRSDLANLCLVCKGWKEVGESKILWSHEVAVLKITDVPAIKVKIIELLALARIGDALLDKKVKTGKELDSMLYSVMYDKSFQENQKQELMNEYCVEINEKFLLHEKINEGFNATMLLSSLGLRGVDKLKQYASFLQEKYGNEKGWFNVTAVYIEEGKFSDALAIVNGPLANTHDKAFIIAKIIYCQVQSDVDQAMETMKPYMEDKYFIESYCFSECYNTILLYAKEAKNFQAVEKAIQTVVGENSKFIEIINLIYAYLDRNDNTQAQRTYKKFKKTIAGVKEKNEFRALIELYVRLGFYDMAWEVAETRKEEDNLIFCVLRNVFAHNKMKG